MAIAEDKKPSPEEEFANLARTRRSSAWGDYYFLLKTNKKWWMLPLILIFLAYGLLMVFMGSGAAPFIYTLF